MSNRFLYLISTLISSSSGFISRYINCEREFLVLSRGIIGSLFLFLLIKLKGRKLDVVSIKQNIKPLILSGILMGFCWISLFRGFEHSLSITSLLNNMYNVIVVVIMSFVYHEKLSKKQIICVISVLIGVLMLSGLFEGQVQANIYGLMYGSFACIGYSIVTIINMRIKGIDPLDKTIVQLFVSSLTVLPFALFGNKIPTSIDTTSIILILIMGIVNTGLLFLLFFGSIEHLSSSEIAIIGYLEPVINIVIGTIFFNESMSIIGIIGTVIVLVAALANELIGNGK